MQPPEYTFDANRLAALASYDILDTPPEPGFDDIVQLAAHVCDVPVALVSLVGADRQWFKARVGLETCETALSSSICVHALIEPELLVIPDLTQDPRTRTNPLVAGAPHIRFYAGAPFRASSGEVLGSLCVIDDTARPDGLTAAQAHALKSLARQVTSQLNLRRAIIERDKLVAEQHRAEARRNALLHLGDCLRDMAGIADMTRTATTIVGQTLNVSRAAFGRLEQNGEYLIVEADWSADGAESLAGRHRLADYGDLSEGLIRGEPLVVDDVRSDPRTTPNSKSMRDLAVRSFVNIPLREHGRTVAVFIVHDVEPHAWPPEVLTFLHNVADRLEVGIARLHAEAEQLILNHELSHRLKNTFAMIQAIASQTLRPIPDQQPVQAFIQRLHALSSAHDVLLEQKRSAAHLEDVVRAVLKTLGQLEHIDITGPEVDLVPRTTLSISLLLHELTTNAIKYGALSDAGGRIAIDWRLDGPTESPDLTLNWRETGGPSVTTPTRTGFGSKLIRMGMTGNGGVDLRFLPTGLEATFKAPLAQVQLS